MAWKNKEGKKKQKAGSQWWRLGCKEGEFPALEERAGCSRAVFLLIPFKDPSGQCCCRCEGQHADSPSAVFVPSDRTGSRNLACSRPVCFVSSKVPNKLTRINVSDLDKDDFF